MYMLMDGAFNFVEGRTVCYYHVNSIALSILFVCVECSFWYHATSSSTISSFAISSSSVWSFTNLAIGHLVLLSYWPFSNLTFSQIVHTHLVLFHFVL